MDAEWLKTVNEALKKNEVTRARELLQGYVRYHRKDRRGWELLSRVTNNPQERALCLTRLRDLDRQFDQPPALPRFQLPLVQEKSAEDKRSAEPPPAQTVNWLSLGLQASFFTGVLILFFLVLIGVLPMFFGYRSLVVVTGSMSPMIPQGSLIIAEPVLSKNLRIGDVIAFSPSPDVDTPLVHRIISIRTKNGTLFFTTRGDANKKSDSIEISLPPTAWLVATHFPFLGYVISYASSTLGLILLIGVPLLLLLAIYAVDLTRKISRWLPPRAGLQA